MDDPRKVGEAELALMAAQAKLMVALVTLGYTFGEGGPDKGNPIADAWWACEAAINWLADK